MAEAAWMATPSLSWMTTVLGDPLYRPFGAPEEVSGPTGYRALRDLAGELPPDAGEAELTEALAAYYDLAGEPGLLEALGLLLQRRDDEEGAAGRFEEAAQLASTAEDQVRLVLHGIDVERRAGRTDDALFRLRKLAEMAREIPAGRAARTLLLELEPPLPPFPKPSGPIPQGAVVREAASMKEGSVGDEERGSQEGGEGRQAAISDE